MGVLRTPGSGRGSTAGAVGGPEAVNSGWAIAQNKANSGQGRSAVTVVLKGSYEESACTGLLRKQSQFVSAGFRVNAGRVGALYKGRDLRLHAARVAGQGWRIGAGTGRVPGGKRFLARLYNGVESEF